MNGVIIELKYGNYTKYRRDVIDPKLIHRIVYRLSRCSDFFALGVL